MIEQIEKIEHPGVKETRDHLLKMKLRAEYERRYELMNERHRRELKRVMLFGFCLMGIVVAMGVIWGVFF